MPSLQELGLEKLWIEFGQGASAQWIPVHEMVSSIGPEKVGGILFSTLSRDVMWSLVSVAKKPSRNSATVRKKLENFVVLMYDRYSAASCVNEARLDLFARKQRTYDAIPPTRAALREHAKRAAYESYGVRRLPQIQKPAPLLTGVGFKVKRRGK